jgi:hypothetical protein
MDKALPWISIPTATEWRDLVLPKEHGSWSLALEPLAFGLITFPSAAGGWLALAVLAGFFARRPLRICRRDSNSGRRRAAGIALAACAVAAISALACALLAGGFGWLPWLAPSVICGGLFLSFDLRNGGREEMAEIAGAAAFAFLPAGLAALGGADPLIAFALAVVMCGRAIPTVWCVRAVLRGAKTGVRRPMPALTAAFAALLAGVALWQNGLVPGIAVIALAALALRATAMLVFPRPHLRARTIGMIEAVLGLAFVVIVAGAWQA